MMEEILSSKRDPKIGGDIKGSKLMISEISTTSSMGIFCEYMQLIQTLLELLLFPIFR